MTSAPVVDERQHRDALVALLTDPLGGHVYDFGMAPGDKDHPIETERKKSPPNIYALLAIERRYVEPVWSGRSSTSGWRAAFRYVGRTVDEARWVGMKIAQALDEERLTIGGFISTPVTHESTSAIERDEGRFSGLSVYVYAL